VRSSGTAEFLDGERRPAGVEEQRVDVLGDGEAFINRRCVAYVNDLDDRHAGHRIAQFVVAPVEERVAELHGICATAGVLLGDIFNTLTRREQKCCDGRADGRGDRCDARVIDHTWPARHRRHETDRVGAGVDSERRLINAVDATNLHADHVEQYHTRHGASVDPRRNIGNPPLEMFSEICKR
jgi:hypothetical protein